MLRKLGQLRNNEKGQNLKYIFLYYMNYFILYMEKKNNENFFIGISGIKKVI